MFNAKRYQAMEEELEKLINANLIREICFIDQLFNVVLVKKALGQ